MAPWDRLLERTAHRPWPPPRRPWLLHMAWKHLLFVHWPVDPERLHAHIPEGLALDRHGGRAWITVAAFLMDDTGLRGLRVPGATRFPELNVRTYVTLDGRPGVWFFSLDAASRLAVAGGRTVRLPYHHADMDLDVGIDGARFSSRRDGAFLRTTYRATGPPALAAPGTLDHWLTERYCLYAARRRKVWRQDIHHPPWPLRPAEADLEGEGLTPFAPGSLAGAPHLLHCTEWQDVVAWAPVRVV